MRKRRVTPIGAAFVALVLLVLLFVVRGALHNLFYMTLFDFIPWNRIPTY